MLIIRTEIVLKAIIFNMITKGRTVVREERKSEEGVLRPLSNLFVMIS